MMKKSKFRKLSIVVITLAVLPGVIQSCGGAEFFGDADIEHLDRRSGQISEEPSSDEVASCIPDEARSDIGLQDDSARIVKEFDENGQEIVHCEPEDLDEPDQWDPSDDENGGDPGPDRPSQAPGQRPNQSPGQSPGQN